MPSPASINSGGARRARAADEAERTPVDLVLEGGGVKGIALVGVVSQLVRSGYTFPRVAGTSVGAIVAAVVAALEAAGKDLSELVAIMKRLRLDKIPQRTSPGFPLLSEGLGLFTHNGLYRSDYLHDWLSGELDTLGVRTFADLRRKDPGEDANLLDDQTYRLVVMSSDVTHGRLLRLPWDYDRLYGRNPDKELVADAVRMSYSIPLFFEPSQLEHHRTHETSVMVDGGLLSNFPVEIFDRTDGRPRRWKTFGVRIFPDLPEGLPAMSPFFRLPAPAPIPFLTQVLTTALVGRDQTHLDLPGVRERTITVNTAGVGVTEFDISTARRDRLVEQGTAEAKRFLTDRENPVATPN